MDPAAALPHHQQRGLRGSAIEPDGLRPRHRPHAESGGQRGPQRLELCGWEVHRFQPTGGGESRHDGSLGAPAVHDVDGVVRERGGGGESGGYEERHALT